MLQDSRTATRAFLYFCRKGAIILLELSCSRESTASLHGQQRAVQCILIRAIKNTYVHHRAPLGILFRNRRFAVSHLESYSLRVGSVIFSPQARALTSFPTATPLRVMSDSEAPASTTPLGKHSATPRYLALRSFATVSHAWMI